MTTPEYRQINFTQIERLGDDWSSIYREGHSRVTEYLEVNLNAARLVSEITFEVAHFPQRVTVEYWDKVTEEWLPWTSRSRAGSNQVCDIRDSNGSPDGEPVMLQQSFDPIIRAVSRFRIGARRLVWEEKDWVNNHRHPSLVDGTHVAYPIVIAALNVAYSATRLEEIPRATPSTTAPSAPLAPSAPYPGATPPVPPAEGPRPATRPAPPLVTHEAPAAPLQPRPRRVTERTIHGTQYSYQMHQTQAGDVLTKPAGVWKCAPQPVTYGVVNFYLDMRDSLGQAQVVDRFFLDPLYSGPSISLYYSNHDPSEVAFEAIHEPISPWLARIEGPGTFVPETLVEPDPVLRLPTTSHIVVEGNAIDLNPSHAWWVGLDITMHASSATAGSRPLLDVDGNVLYLTTGRMKWKASSGEVIDLDVVFDDLDRLQILAGYDSVTSQIFLHVQTPDGYVVTDALAIPALSDTLAEKVYIGKTDVNVGTSSEGGFDLRALVVKSGVPLTEQDVSDWLLRDPKTYVLHGALDDADLDDSTDNALLRFHPSFVSVGNPTGLYGGPGDYYQDLVWQPVLRDFRSSKGYMNFPPTKAKYWKFEFSNLVAEPRNLTEPMTTVVKTFPASTLTQYRAPVARRDDKTLRYLHRDTGIMATIALADAMRYSDGMGNIPDTINSSQFNRHTQTEAFHSIDPATQSALRRMGSAWSYVPWHIPDEAPKHKVISAHVYDQTQVVHESKVAFFAGLKAVVPSREDYSAVEDTQQYIEPFINLRNVYANSFQLEAGGVGFDMEDGYLTSGEQDYAEAISNIFPSVRKVRAIQFATTQSNARQMLRDNDFNDPLHLYWTTVGDATFAPDTVEIGGIGNTLGIIRDGSQTTGGFESWPVEIAKGGRIHAAARLYSTVPLNAPLWLQIVNDDNGAVLVEKSVEVTGDKPVEWYVGINIADLAVGVTKVRARCIQKATTSDRWNMDDVSVYEDPIVWEFSVNGNDWFPAIDIKNNPHGVLAFPHSDDPTANRSLRWRVSAYRPMCTIGALVIRPWYEGAVASVVSRSPIPIGGPNVSPYDDLPAVEDDPRFKVWSNPIPHDWWLSFRSLFLNSVTPLMSRHAVFLHDDLVQGVDSG